MIWSQQDVARHGGPVAVDAMRRGVRGYAGGGIVGVTPMPVRAFTNSNIGPAIAAAPVAVNVHNYGQQQVRVEEQTDERGGRQVNVMIEERVSAALTRPGSSANRAMRTSYGLPP